MDGVRHLLFDRLNQNWPKLMNLNILKGLKLIDIDSRLVSGLTVHYINLMIFKPFAVQKYKDLILINFELIYGSTQFLNRCV